MKVTQSKYFYYGVITISILIILFSIYYQLGGFKEFKVNAFDSVDYAMAGVDFRGKYNSQDIQDYYEKARDQIASGEVNGILSLIDYVDEDLGDDEVHYFIGIILLERITEVPPGFVIRKFKSRGVLGVTLDTHPLVRPAKGDIEALIYSTAQENGLELEDYFLEKHFADDRVVVEGFVK